MNSSTYQTSTPVNRPHSVAKIKSDIRGSKTRVNTGIVLHLRQLLANENKWFDAEFRTFLLDMYVTFKFVCLLTVYK